jgi:hypothetical protein
MAELERASKTRAFLSSHKERMTRRTRELRVFLFPALVASSAGGHHSRMVDVEVGIGGFHPRR